MTTIPRSTPGRQPEQFDNERQTIRRLGEALPLTPTRHMYVALQVALDAVTDALDAAERRTPRRVVAAACPRRRRRRAERDRAAGDLPVSVYEIEVQLAEPGEDGQLIVHPAVAGCSTSPTLRWPGPMTSTPRSRSCSWCRR
jgi:hypothetical protein